MTGTACLVMALVAILAVHVHAQPCEVRARTDAGPVRGLLRRADDNSVYASFRGVPYAKQPVGELRFKELEPLEPWVEVRDAKVEGPVCFQTDVLYGKIMQPRSMSESCIYANIHVPIEALPDTCWSSQLPAGLPILVFIHGGGFAFGSGDSDLHGPEYMVSKKVIVITFNYRLNVFGFLSLNSTNVPGNAGLRDMITLLRWVQRNARSFGGDPDNVTLAGQSAGAISAHLLALSKPAKGLFKRAILMSGTAISSFYSTSPFFAYYIQKQLLATLRINATDPNEIYQELIALPAEKLCEANNFLIEQTGLTTFVPTVETTFPGVTPVLDDSPDILIAKGRDKDITLLVGYTNSECETFRARLEEFNLVQKSKENPIIIVPPALLFTTPPTMLPDVAKKIDRKYYNGTISVDGFVKSCTDGFYEYPVLKLVEGRGNAKVEGIEESPVYVYKFSHESNNGIFKRTVGLKYHGAGHVDDLTYIFKTNSVLGSHSSAPKNEDYDMRNFMVKFFVNFMNCSKPICDETDLIWPPATRDRFLYEAIDTPNVYQVKDISPKQQEIIKFFDSLTIAE